MEQITSHNKCCDCNFCLYEKIKAIHSLFLPRMGNVEERIKKLEDMPKFDLFKPLNEMCERLSELEAKVNSLQYGQQFNKKPHKCPVCDASGKRYFGYGTIIECAPCEGKGIIWR